MKERDAAASLQHLRSVIDALPARRRPRREERPTVTIPGARGEPAGEDDDEDEDED